MIFRQSSLKKGFTLIELLVVIAIIALLMSIITPALRKAKDHAKKIHCSANLRSLSMAVLMYADNNDAQTPCSTNRWDNPYKPGWSGVTTDLSTGLPLPLNEQFDGNSNPYTGLVRGQLWAYVESPDVWRCPSDLIKENMRSYCMGGQWWGGHTTSANGVTYDPGANGKVYRKINKIKNPGGRFMFVDNVGLNDDAYAAIWYSQPEWWNIPNYMHSGGSVNGFADGHVSAYKLGSQTFKLARESAETARATGDIMYIMIDNSAFDEEDLEYYQRATWGETGW